MSIYNLTRRSGQLIFSEIQNDYGIKINIIINIKIKNSKIKNQLINFISKFSKKKNQKKKNYNNFCVEWENKLK